MAAKKSTKAKKTTTKSVRKSEQQTPRLIDSFKFGESYTSLILGIIAIIVVVVLLIAFVRGRNAENNDQATSSTQTQQNEVKTYIVQSGDDLWNIAEDELGSGYEWVTIAEENNLTNPDQLEEGTELIIPARDATRSASAVTPTEAPTPTETEVADSGDAKIQSDMYTVVQGDTLWDISVRAYGDGYGWVQIAQANNIPNPDIIYPGTELTIPQR